MSYYSGGDITVKSGEEKGEEHVEVRLPGEGEVIGIIERMLGHDKARVKCMDGRTRVCRIPGRMRKRVWVKEGDVVLVAIWDFQPETRGDIIYKYSQSEVRKLKEMGKVVLPEEEY